MSDSKYVEMDGEMAGKLLRQLQGDGIPTFEGVDIVTNNPQSKSLDKQIEELLSWGRATAPDGTEMVMLNDKLETMIPLAQAINQLISDITTEAVIDILERLCCCDNEPINAKDEINVCNSDHIFLLTALKAQPLNKRGDV